MAVYTKIDETELKALVAELGLGRLTAYSGVPDGLENSTYFVSTKRAQGIAVDWVLTILEVEDPEQLSFSVALVEQLGAGGLPVAALVANTEGSAIHQIAGKQALLARKVVGVHLQASVGPGLDCAGGQGEGIGHRVTEKHCAAIGDFLGRMHRQSVSMVDRNGDVVQHANPYGLSWAKSTARSLAPSLFSKDKLFIDQQLSRQEKLRASNDGMPVGAIHADLFRDNALFKGEILSAVIDFQSACTDWLLLDVAIAVNDWASNPDGELDTPLLEALLSAYGKQRPFTSLEGERWQDVLCFAALQFWLSRLLTRFQATLPENPSELTGRPGKDSEQYARILRCRVAGVPPLLAGV